MMMNDANTIREPSSVSRLEITRTCLCRERETCKGLTASFCFLDDPRKRFVKLPSERVAREAYLQCLLPNHHPIESDVPSSEFIAAHHFHPAIVKHYENDKNVVVPLTTTEEEAALVGIELDDNHVMYDQHFHRRFIVLPDYSLEQSVADVISILDSKDKGNNKACLCGETYCKGLTVAFAMQDDPRNCFVRLPRYRKGRGNRIRKAYLKYLMPHHKFEDETPTQYIAAHHFDPSIVLAQHEQNGCGDGSEKIVVPQTISEEEAALFGMLVDEDDAAGVDESGRQLFLVVPNYPIEWSKADVDTLLNHRLMECYVESVEHHGFQFQPLPGPSDT